jgi:hypothetical protein
MFQQIGKELSNGESTGLKTRYRIQEKCLLNDGGKKG